MLAKLYTDLVRVARGTAAASCVTDPVGIRLDIFRVFVRKFLQLKRIWLLVRRVVALKKKFHKKCTESKRFGVNWACQTYKDKK